jgi:hypothetical protein
VPEHRWQWRINTRELDRDCKLLLGEVVSPSPGPLRGLPSSADIAPDHPMILCSFRSLLSFRY